ncbi:ATPase AAA [Thermincola ferriacetica]|uniref:ATPase AAA n=1 Tax=Thermincola ferriacetica TaxID=281456 RepID=A0A0L6W4U5_9FIRM|nr:AAA family ATPase [Thermincola ferriacetica]KNZ70398.1 ATPase AAA [Thermincola ferriacetica]
MIKEFFGFSHVPFTKEIATDFIFPSEQHQELTARLRYAIENRYLSLVTGEIGAGKSTAIRALCKSLDPSKYRFVYLSESRLSPRIFYQEVLYQLDTEPGFLQATAKRRFVETIRDFYDKHHVLPVIVVDEGQELSTAMINEFRFVINFDVDSRSPLALILTGQPELRDRLKLRALRAIDQRINVRFHLNGLSEEETKKYIFHALQKAGGTHMFFSDDAVKALYVHSNGIPRLINAICTDCLVDAVTRQQHTIDATTVARVIAERQ